MEDKKNYTNTDEYIATFSIEIQQILEEVRQAIKEVAPHATEKISYAMPTFDLNGNLVHFAAFKNHIGFYPTPSGTEAFQDKISKYKAAKGSIQFPLDQPMPIELIKEIVAFRVTENLSKPVKKSRSR